MIDETKCIFFAIGGIILLEAFALHKGVDGAMFGASMTAIGVIIGYIIKAHISHHRRKKKKKK